MYKRQPREPAQQRRIGGTQLHAGELGADAAVDAVAEGQVRGGGGAGGVEGVHVGAEGGVPVGAAQGAEHDVTGGDPLARDLHVLAGEAREGDLNHRQVPQQLLDEGVDGRVLVAEGDEVLGVPEEDEGAEGEHAGCGLQAAGQHAVGEARELLVVDVVAVLLHQHAEQPVAGVLALLLDYVAQVGERLGYRAERGVGAREEVEAGGAEALELLAVLVRDAEQLADDQRGDRHRERLDEVDRVAVLPQRLHLVQPLLDEVVDARGESAEAPHGEFGGEQPAQPGVDGRIAEAEPAGVVVLGHPGVADEVGEVVAEAIGLAEHGTRLVVPRDQPHIHVERYGELGDRGLFAHLAQLGHRVEAVPAERHQGGLGEQPRFGQIKTTLTDICQKSTSQPGADTRTNVHHARNTARSRPLRAPADRLIARRARVASAPPHHSTAVSEKASSTRPPTSAPSAMAALKAATKRDEADSRALGARASSQVWAVTETPP